MADIAKDSGVSRQAVYLHFGSRPELLVAAVRYADELLHLKQRFEPVQEAKEGAEKLDAFINFWGHYVSEIYGIAKALMLSRESDEAAAAAWDDRMTSLRNGCQDVIESLKREELLRDDWSVSEATDMLWTTLSINGWELLTMESGWTVEAYVRRIQQVARRLFLRIDS